VTWTRRKTLDLLRLLKEYKRTRHLPDWKGWAAPEEPMGEVAHTIWTIEFMEDEGEFRGRDRDKDILPALQWWCEIVRDRYGMKRHTAIKWLMQQYYDKEGNQIFSRNWGATVDSAARRLSQKMKYHEGIDHHDRDKYAEKYAAALKEEAGDINQLMSKLLDLFPEPESCRK
jgi:hypothetical protein